MKKPKNLFASPGVYLFKGKKKEVLYVGRAVNLKRRISQYFSHSTSSGQAKNIDFRIAEMVAAARSLQQRKTRSLWEAVILEANLIKKYLPKYNIREKDNKSFLYFAIPFRGVFPQPFLIRQRELKKFTGKGLRIFGPFQSASLMKNLLRIVRRLIPYSSGRCKPESGRPCFDYQVGLCPGVCRGIISSGEYKKNIRDLILLFSGKKNRIIQRLKKENPERAKLFEHIQDVALLQNEEKTGKGNLAKRLEAYDISHFGGKETYGAMAVFLEGERETDEYRLFKIKQALPGDDLHALEEMLVRRFRHKEWQAPGLILIDGGTPQVRHCAKVLKNLKIGIPLAGISKYENDKLVFPAKTKPSFKKAIGANKIVLLRARDEAHRFGNRARKRSTRLLGS